jgi:hypothetical protein
VVGGFNPLPMVVATHALRKSHLPIGSQICYNAAGRVLGSVGGNMRQRNVSRYIVILLAIIPFTTACAAMKGYPNDPEDTQQTLAVLQSSFGPASEKAYYNETDATKRQADRNQLIYDRMHAYDLEFENFEKSLYSSGNALSTGSDLVVLALNGLGATIGTSATKAALAAASAGIVGANGAIDKDLYYQRTLPALIAQMEAARSQAKVAIYAGLQQSDAQYPLAKADLDLEALQRAGGIPAAITDISTQAGTALQTNNATIDSLRSGTFSTSTSTKRILAWLYPGGNATDAAGNAVTPNATNLAALNAWLQKDPTLSQIPFATFLYNADSAGQLEADRQHAITALNIP